MRDDSAKLATLVGSRLCHDLVSPVGAISNGLELIALAGKPGTEEMNLIEASCASATARINFFRVAFGRASGEQMIGPREARKVLEQYCGAGRLSADWQIGDDKARPEVQLAFLAFLCCESALPQGGRVQISNGEQSWRISATGPRVNVEKAIWAQLSSDRLIEDLPPSRVHFACLADLATQRNRRMKASAGEAAVTIELT
ncbi:histidine phosphotransferase family protein [Salipiger sp.]|uniref:histidine phosphotransferase family protein n=1 Tax=Salipiger sp. TaxID=2078585 RepID=UPI003A976D10